MSSEVAQAQIIVLWWQSKAPTMAGTSESMKENRCPTVFIKILFQMNLPGKTLYCRHGENDYKGCDIGKKTIK